MELGIISIILLTALCTFINPLRGGQFRIEVPVLENLPNDVVASLILAVGLTLFLGPLSGFIVVVAYKLGESFGWTRWLWAFDPNMTQERYNTEPHKEAPNGWANQWEWGSTLADRLIDPRKNWKLNAHLGFGIRSLMWWAPVYGTLTFLMIINPFTAVIATLAAAALQPVCYNMSSNTFKKGGDASGWVGRAEYFYGAAYGLILGLALSL